MITFNLNGKKINCPSTWDDLTFDQYERLTTVGDDNIELLSILTGIPRETLAKATIKGADQVIASLEFISSPPDWNQPVKQVGQYKLPVNKKGIFDIQFESLAQFEDMRKMFQKVKDWKELTKIYPEMVAIYLQKIRDKEYSYDAAIEMATEIRQYKAREVVGCGSFFTLKLLNLSSITKTTSRTTNQNPKKFKPVSRSSKKRSGRTR